MYKLVDKKSLVTMVWFCTQSKGVEPDGQVHAPDAPDKNNHGTYYVFDYSSWANFLAWVEKGENIG
eukprot:5765857-Prorocentrum_lima.AAC.1